MATQVGPKSNTRLWSGEVKPYNGVHYQLAETLCQPLLLQIPHPPIMIGGMGEKKTLKLVAQYADACNLFVRAGMDILAHKLEVLKGHCKDVGRPFEEIELTSLGSANLVPGEMSAQDVIATCRELADLGIQHAIFNMPGNVQDITPLEVFRDEIIPAVADY